MKKVLSSVILVILFFSFSTLPIVYASELDNFYDVDKQFSKLQEDIDNILTVQGNSYTFNKQAVKDIIFKFKFRFDLFNKKYNKNYTEQNFYEDVVKSIENANLEVHFLQYGRKMSFGINL